MKAVKTVLWTKNRRVSFVREALLKES